MKLVECVPNISDGRRPEVYNAVAAAAASVSGVTLLNVDPGADTNRTVITFVGDPESVLEAAFRLTQKGVEMIDMTTHRGAHPRIGAVDVVPFIPVANVTMEECADLARRLGEPVWEPGILKAVKAVGWVIPEFGCAQVSINLTDLDVTPLHVVFDTCDERARERGLRVTGSEIVGLVPRQVLLDSGRHYLEKMGRPTGVPESALVHAAIRTLGLSEVKEFDPKERVIEYRLATPAPLASMSLREFTDELSSESPAPGGGSVSALAASMAAGLASTVAVLSHTKKGFESKQSDLDRIAVRAQELKDRMLAAVDADTAAFDALLDVMRMPKDNPAREAALADATVAAAEVPLGVLEACPEIVELNREIARIGLQASLSDAGVGAQMARAGGAGAYQNVCINLGGLTDAARRAALLARADAAWAAAKSAHAEAEREILEKLRGSL